MLLLYLETWRELIHIYPALAILAQWKCTKSVYADNRECEVKHISSKHRIEIMDFSGTVRYCIAKDTV